MSQLTDLYEEIALCQQCKLYKTSTRVVTGEGPNNAQIMFVGEGPGYWEDKQGRPFVGPAGQFLDQLIHSIGLKRSHVYITNIIKHRPPNNRDPMPEEVQACRVWLDRQIEIINPRMIITLGRYSMALFFPGKSVGRIHGQAERRGDVIFVAMYHPAAALHQGNLRAVIEEDFKKIPRFLTEMSALPKQEEKIPPSEQLSLF
jgi:DNA polymerase